MAVMQKTTREDRKYEHSGVAPIIATLLMVAIAVVGGILIFVFAQGFFTDTQITTSPPVESLSIIGFDARDIDGGAAVPEQLCANGEVNADATGVTADNALKGADSEFISIYVLNNSPKAITLTELKIAGVTYDSYIASGPPAAPKDFSLYNNECVGKDDVIATIQPGETVTIVGMVSGTLKVGREAPVNIQTTAGNTFTASLVVGTQRG